MATWRPIGRSGPVARDYQAIGLGNELFVQPVFPVRPVATRDIHRTADGVSCLSSVAANQESRAGWQTAIRPSRPSR